MIAVIGLNLLPTAFDMASNNIMIAMITLAIALIINNFGKGFIKQLGILIAVIIGYILSLVLGVVDTTTIAQASLFEIPKFTCTEVQFRSNCYNSASCISSFYGTYRRYDNKWSSSR